MVLIMTLLIMTLLIITLLIVTLHIMIILIMTLLIMTILKTLNTGDSTYIDITYLYLLVNDFTFNTK